MNRRDAGDFEFLWELKPTGCYRKCAPHKAPEKMSNAFIRLISELSLLLGGSSPDEEDVDQITAVRVVIDDIAFLISCRDAPAGLLTIHCSVGSLAEDANASQLLRILQKNVDLASRCAGTLGIDGASRAIIYSCFASLRGTTASQLLQGLHRCARMARSLSDFISAAEPPISDQPMDTLFPFV